MTSRELVDLLYGYGFKDFQDLEKRGFEVGLLPEHYKTLVATLSYEMNLTADFNFKSLTFIRGVACITVKESESFYIKTLNSN